MTNATKANPAELARCGLQDAYVAWIRDEARPHDLEFTPDMFAVASI